MKGTSPAEEMRAQGGSGLIQTVFGEENTGAKKCTDSKVQGREEEAIMVSISKSSVRHGGSTEKKDGGDGHYQGSGMDSCWVREERWMVPIWKAQRSRP